MTKRKSVIIDTYVEQLVKQTPTRPQITVPIYVKPEFLARLHAHRVQYARHREPQHKILEKILKFYEEHHPPCDGSSTPNGK